MGFENRESTATWYLYHALALLSLALLTAGIVLNVYAISHRDELHTVLQSNAATFHTLAPLLGVCVLASLWLWIAMFAHYLKHRPATRTVLWGWFLVLCNWGAALVYFVLIWRPGHARAAGIT